MGKNKNFRFRYFNNEIAIFKRFNTGGGRNGTDGVLHIFVRGILKNKT
jgi:hypothetical protein